jgi:hypothetical protein
MSTAGTDLVQAITAAVGTAALVSAAALLAVGVSQKHSSLADRVRALAAELRRSELSPARRRSLEIQIRLFHTRIGYVARAHRSLYLAVCAFLVMVLVTALRPIRWQELDGGLFLVGICLTIMAVVLEFMELRLSDRTIHEEARDVLDLDGRQSPRPPEG